METLSKTESLVVKLISEKNKVKYYINGDSYKLEYKNGKYITLFKNKEFKIEKKFTYALSVLLSTNQIKTINPRSICLDFILDKEYSIIQITDIFSKVKNSITEKLIEKYKKNFETVKYGDISIVMKVASFNYGKFIDSKISEFTEKENSDIISNDISSKNLCSILFETCCNTYLGNTYALNRAEIYEKNNVKVVKKDGRIQRVYGSCFYDSKK